MEVPEDNARQLLVQSFFIHARELHHVFHIDTGFLRNGYGQGFAGSVHRSGHPLRPDGAPGKHVSLAFKFPVFIQYFQGAKQVVGSIV